VTPKGETQLTPERENCCARSSAKKAGDVRDASLYCPPGIEGIVVDVEDLLAQGGRKKMSAPRRLKAIRSRNSKRTFQTKIRILTDERLKRLEGLLGGKEVQADLHDERTNKRLFDQRRDSRPRCDRTYFDPQSEADQVCRQGPAR